MDGWKTALAFYATDTPSQRFRPGGLLSVRVQSNPVQTWTRKSPFERRGREKAVINAVQVSVTRNFSPDAFMARLMECISDTWVAGQGGIGPEPKAAEKTYGLDLQFPDGAKMRYTGLALKSLTIVIQSGRVVEEESVWVALKAEPIDTIQAAAPDAAMLTAASRAEHRIDTSLPDVTDATWPGQPSRAFSTQLQFERNLEACQFKTTGEATRHRKTTWEVTGHSIVRLPSSDFSLALNNDAEAALHWRIRHESGAEVKIALCNAIIRVNNQESLAGEIEHTLDFIAHSTDNQTAYIAVT